MSLEIPIDYANGDESAIGEVSDGYHTFNELYAHRCALFLALGRALGLGWKSRQHANGHMYPGWFIAGLTLPMVGEITSHVPLDAWDTTPYLRMLDQAPSWDGHTSDDVIERLRMYAAVPQDDDV